MFTVIFRIIIFVVWPFKCVHWCAKAGKGLFFPNFERMKREYDKSIGFSLNDGIFAHNRIGGKIAYYFLLVYCLLISIPICFFALLFLCSVIFFIISKFTPLPFLELAP
jgi:hypothetical protein